MAATETCAAPVQEDGGTEPKSEVETTNSETINNETVNNETVNNETVNNETVNNETVTETVVSTPAEAPPAGEAPQSTEQPADSKVKPASDNLLQSFLNKSGLGKVMGGRKKKEQSTGAEEANADGATEQQKAPDQEEEQAADGAVEAGADDQAIEKAPENDDGSQEQKPPAVEPKQGAKSSVRDLIRKPVARIFSHRSTEKKDGSGEPQKTVRSKSLDRLEDPEACNVTVDQTEDQPAAEDSQKPTSQTTKHMTRWHSFKKLMAQKSHKKSTEDAKDTEVTEGAIGDTPGDTGTLDSKSELSGQKRWKLKRSWTFQGMKRDPSVVGISKVAKGTDKDSSDNLKGEDNATEADQGDAADADESKAQADSESQEKTSAEGEEEKGAAAAATTQRAKSVDQHANEIWTSFKKHIIPKSKRPAADSAGGGEEEGAEAAAASTEQEQTEDLQAGKEQAKSAKAKRTHFNRAVSLKNFILRKGKSTSVDQGEGAQKEGEAAAADREAKDTEEAPAGTSDSQPGEAAADAAPSESNDKGGEAQVVNEHTGAGKETKQPAAPEAEKADSAEPAAPAEAAAEVKTNGENGCSNGTSEENSTHNHESSPQTDGPTDEVKQDKTNSTKDAKILNIGKGNAVSQSEKKAGNV